MVAIIGTILLVGYTTLSVSHSVESIYSIAKNKPTVVQNNLNIAYEDNPALLSIVDYYHTKSPWAGEFEIEQISKFKADLRHDDMIDVHVRYRYKSIRKGRRESYDQRLFVLKAEGDNFKVISIGEYDSAQFDR